MTGLRPAFYARAGSAAADFVAVLHPPYTLWHLSYLCLGAALAPAVDWVRLVGALAAFLLGTGVAAHALDEWRSRPLLTQLSDRTLLALALVALLMVAAIAIAGALVISPWIIMWAAGGMLLAVAYAIEWHRWLHSDIGFALAWGAFPVLAGFWIQAQTLSVAAFGVALAATLLSLTQRSLSSHARFVRRQTTDAVASFALPTASASWDRERLLGTWERPLKLLAAAMVVLALGLLATHV